MLIFKCNNKNCDCMPCFVRCDKNVNSGKFGDESINPPTECPYCNDTPNWRIATQTGTDPGTAEELDEWFNDNYDRVRQDIRDIIEDICLFEKSGGEDYMRLVRCQGLMRNAAQDMWERNNILEKLERQYTKRELVTTALISAFRAGMIYAEMLELDKDDRFTSTADDF